jgi:hypothetical protein
MEAKKTVVEQERVACPAPVEILPEPASSEKGREKSVGIKRWARRPV